MPNKILIIEDEHAVRGLYADELAAAGFEVDQAQDGDIGMEKIMNTQWEVLVLDIMLPGKDGLRMLKEMKLNPSLKKGPVVVVTNLSSEHIVHEALSFGADAYLVKADITPDKVVDSVKECLKAKI